MSRKEGGRGALCKSIGAAALALQACAFGPAAREAPALYDLGSPRTYPAANPPLAVALLVAPVRSPSWLDSPAIVYRFAFAEPQRPRAYVASRWAAPPAALLTQRLRARFTAASGTGIVTGAEGARADYALYVELEDFSQLFDTPDSSRVAVRVRASLVDLASRSLLAQRGFALERAAPAADAAGAARGLAQASDELIERILDWAKERLAAAPTR
jgi:cholesterol transport system auxiliary component